MKRGLKVLNKVESGRRFAIDNLKRCPLCGTVNSVQSHECVTCRWHGDFVTDPEAIEESVLELLERNPDLAEAVLAPPPRRKRRGLVGWFSMIKWLIRGRLDFKI